MIKKEKDRAMGHKEGERRKGRVSYFMASFTFAAALLRGGRKDKKRKVEGRKYEWYIICI